MDTANILNNIWVKPGLNYCIFTLFRGDRQSPDQEIPHRSAILCSETDYLFFPRVSPIKKGF